MKQTDWRPRVALLFPTAGGVILTAFAVIGLAGHHADERLAQAEMGTVRGGLLNRYQGLFFCHDLYSPAPCTPGAACLDCNNMYLDTGSTTHGGYDPGTPGLGIACGKVKTGTCTAQRYCDTSGGTNTATDCPKSPTVPMAQGPGGGGP